VGPLDGVAHFHWHQTGATLSDELWIVSSRTSQCCASTSWWAILVANSNSILLMFPFSNDTSYLWMSRGNGERHRCGCTVSSSQDTNCTPSILSTTAYCAPRVSGCSHRIISEILVGRRVPRLPPYWSNWCTGWVIITLWPWSHLFFNNSWRALNNPFPTGIVRTIDWSSPSSFCNLMTVVYLLLGRCDRIWELE
jgi:hypothetical protein